MENEIENENRNVIIKENEAVLNRQKIIKYYSEKKRFKCNINTCKHWGLRKFSQI